MTWNIFRGMTWAVRLKPTHVNLILLAGLVIIADAGHGDVGCVEKTKGASRIGTAAMSCAEAASFSGHYGLCRRKKFGGIPHADPGGGHLLSRCVLK